MKEEHSNNHEKGKIMQPMELKTMLPEDVDIVYYSDALGFDTAQNVEHLSRDGVEFLGIAIEHVAFPADIIDPENSWVIYADGSRQVIADIARGGLLDGCGEIVKVEGFEM